MRKLIREGLYLSGMLSLAANAALIYPLTAGGVTPSLFGRFTSGLAAIVVLSPLLAAGLHVYVLRTRADSDAETQSLADGVARRATALLLVASALLAMVSTLIDHAALVAAAMASAAGLISTSHARGSRSPVSFAILTVGLQTVAIGTGGVALVWTGGTESAFQAIALMTLLLTGTYLVRRAKGSAYRVVSTEEWRSALRFSLALCPHLVLLLVLLQGSRLLVAGRLGFEAAANFQFAATLGGLAVTTVILLNGSYSTDALAHTGEAFRRECLRYGQRLASICSVLAICTALAALLAMRLWLPEGYDVEAVTHATMAFLPAAALQAAGDVQATLALHHYKSSIVSLATALGTFVSSVLILALAPKFGLSFVGVAISTGLLVRALSSAALLCRHGIGPIRCGRLYLAAAFSAGVAVIATVM